MHLTDFHFYNYKNYHYSKPVKGLRAYEVGYGFSFNGMEKDDESKGEGNSYTTLHRIYDSRLGIWLSTDPEEVDYTEISPYASMDNNPIKNTDPDGDDWIDALVGYGIGAVTNIVPNSTHLRNTYIPKDADDYNASLRATDNIAIVGGIAGVASGGNMMAGGGGLAAGGGLVALSVVGAPAGAAMATVGGGTASTGAAVALGSGLVLTNGVNNRNAGYNYGKPKQKTSNSTETTQNANSKTSTKSQTVYGLKNKETKGIEKVGLSSGKNDKKGSPYRANIQVNKYSKNKYESVVLGKVSAGKNARSNGLDLEKKLTNANKKTINPKIHKRPKPE